MRISYTDLAFFDDLVTALRAAGHNDLAGAVAAKRLQYHMRKFTGLRGMVARFDRRFLGGLLKYRYRRMPRYLQH